MEDNKQQLHYILIIQCYISYIFLGTICPYKLPADVWMDEPTQWLPLSYPDLCHYLIKTPGVYIYLKKESYTRKITKPCKSRSTFSFCLGGFKMWYM